MKHGLPLLYRPLLSLLPVLLLTASPLANADSTVPKGKTPRPAVKDKHSWEMPRLRIGVGVGVATREYMYRGSSDPSLIQLRSYSSTPIPFVRVHGEVYPIPQFSAFGIAGSFDKQQQSMASTGLGSVTVRAKAWQVNLRYRHFFGDLELTGEMGIGGQAHQFLEVEEPLLVTLPSVDYLIGRLGFQAGHKLGNKVSLTLGGNLLSPIEIGPIADQRGSSDPASPPPLYEQISVYGFSAFIALAYVVKSNMRAKILYSASHFSHEYESSFPNQYSSASDDFRTLGISLEFVQ